MSTSTSPIDKTSSTAKRVGNAPLPVLARIPWLAGDARSSQAAASESLATALTHFEYLLGEFGMCRAIDTDSLDSNRLAGATDSRFDAEQFGPKPLERAPALDAPSRPAFSWSELLLRLDAAVEPYTRAIVVLVLVAVGAFTLLLLRNAEAPHPPQTAPATTTARPLPEAATEPNTSHTRSTPAGATAAATTVDDADDANPTASGPAGMPMDSEPPVATLGSDIRPVPFELEDDSGTYPSTALAPPNNARNTQSSSGEKPTSTLK